MLEIVEYLNFIDIQVNTRLDGISYEIWPPFVIIEEFENGGGI